jgi:hypothetical protein
MDTFKLDMKTRALANVSIFHDFVSNVRFNNDTNNSLYKQCYVNVFVTNIY